MMKAREGRTLGLVSCIVCFESMLFTVLAPLLAHLSEQFGLSETAAGLLSAAYAAGALVAAVPSGLLTARVGIKLTTVGSLLLLGAASVAFALAPTVEAVFAARFLQGCGASFAWTGGFAWLVSLSPADRRGEVIGVAFAAAVAGTLVGPAVGTLATVTGSRPVFIGLAAPAGALAAWALAVRDGPRQELSLRSFRHALRERPLYGPALMIALAGLLLGALSVLGPLHLVRLGWSTTAVGGMFLAAAAVQVAVNPIVGRRSDRHGRTAPLRVALALSALASLALAVDTGRWWYAAAVVAGGVAFGALWTPGTALLSDVTTEARFDVAMGFALLNLTWPPGQFLGAALGGAIAQATSDTVPYAFACLVCLLAFLAIGGREARAGG
jgi:MFS family permease